ncbi:hypothetical protein NT2_04_01440 [Caenibius tardaugens NBRC 16725]|uniref:Uncharacterized protein n=1 Tax=Caenibius tardaugens NBRC 16725 TaxID=1219035 RepID=U3A1V2_9SPHN|nr:hypothetical protein [Caenibius tardaugens]AZI36176.1 hypothetical protein EGO55_09565 [Caenibius tardaugens NBRC 16725]GAD48733.1 hypothetical protein NT2_04_01440 [Caenibius tardaugens NBRC 16725]
MLKTQKSAREKPQKAPISAHPLFGAVVALWFGALFGLGSAVLPGGLYESLVNRSGLAAVLPAAAPPLGLTARLLIALAASGLGVVIGLMIARQISTAQVAAKPSRKVRALDSAPQLAIGAEDDQRPARRRSFTPAVPESTPEPVIEEATCAAPVAQDHAIEPDHYEPAYDTATEADTAGEADLADEPTLSDDRFENPLTPGTVDWDAVTVGDETFDAPALPEAVANQVDVPASEAHGDFAAAFATGHTPAPAFAAIASDAIVTDPPEPAVHAHAPQAVRAPRRRMPHPISLRPLEQLGMVELVERLAHAIHARQERTRGDSLARTPADLSPPAIVPAALRPITFDHDDDFDEFDASEAASLSLPIGDEEPAAFRVGSQTSISLAAAAMTPDDQPEEPDDGHNHAENDGYSSLLSIQKPFLPPDWDKEESDDDAPEDAQDNAMGERESLSESALSESGAALILRRPQIDHADTEQALRDALVGLQQIGRTA